MDTQNDSLGRADAMSVKKETFLTVNKKWIEHSHLSVEHYSTNDKPNIKQVRELDMVGLFETSWMIFNHPGDMYGYPK